MSQLIPPLDYHDKQVQVVAIPENREECEQKRDNANTAFKVSAVGLSILSTMNWTTLAIAGLISVPIAVIGIALTLMVIGIIYLINTPVLHGSFSLLPFLKGNDTESFKLLAKDIKRGDTDKQLIIYVNGEKIDREKFEKTYYELNPESLDSDYTHLTNAQQDTAKIMFESILKEYNLPTEVKSRIFDLSSQTLFNALFFGTHLKLKEISDNEYEPGSKEFKVIDSKYKKIINLQIDDDGKCFISSTYKFKAINPAKEGVELIYQSEFTVDVQTGIMDFSTYLIKGNLNNLNNFIFQKPYLQIGVQYDQN